MAEPSLTDRVDCLQRRRPIDVQVAAIRANRLSRLPLRARDTRGDIRQRARRTEAAQRVLIGIVIHRLEVWPQGVEFAPR